MANVKTRLTVRLEPRVLTRWLAFALRWIGEHLIQTVPEEMSICEYECQDPWCSSAKWATCDRRRSLPGRTPIRID